MNSVIKQHPLYKLSKISIIELIMSEYVHCDEIPTPQADNELVELKKELQECKERSVKQRAEIVSLTEKLTNVRSQLSASVSMNENVLPEGAFQIQIDSGDNVIEQVSALKTELNNQSEEHIKELENQVSNLKNKIGGFDDNKIERLEKENKKLKQDVSQQHIWKFDMEALTNKNLKYKKMLCLLNELLLETTN